MNKAIVGIIMGSDSDLPIMKDAAEILNEFQINYEIKIVSAHRTPDLMFDYAKSAVKKGLKVIIAGAGGAAHLPGMVASLTPLPVIGVPIQTKTLGGVDSLHSIVQMPAGIPVATVAINGAKNAGLLAAKIIGSSNPEVLKKVEKYSKNLEKTILQKSDNLEKLGFEKYLEQKNNTT